MPGKSNNWGGGEKGTGKKKKKSLSLSFSEVSFGRLQRKKGSEKQVINQSLTFQIYICQITPLSYCILLKFLLSNIPSISVAGLFRK